MHIFKYSPRKGTKAVQMEYQIDAKTKEERSQKLIQLSNQNQENYNKKYEGKEVEVLFEEEKEGYCQGHTKNYILVKCKKDEKYMSSKTIKVTCMKGYKDYILAE